MVDAPSAYPLAWPQGRPRCAALARRKGEFGTILRTPAPMEAPGLPPPRHRKPKPVTLTEARERLAVELDRLDASGPILSTNVELRVDGHPRSGMAEPRDPGVAVYFQLAGKPVVLACDSYTSVAQNIAAIAAHIDSMRRQERYGVATMAQMFTGFLALPAPMVLDDWRAALGDPKTLAEAEASFREQMKQAYPNGIQGSETRARELNAALARAREALGK